jgi:hypothetical protein
LSKKKKEEKKRKEKKRKEKKRKENPARHVMCTVHLHIEY